MKPLYMQMIGRAIRLRTCPACFYVYHAQVTHCPHCKEEYPTMKKVKKVKLTPDRKMIQELTAKLSSVESSLRSSQYRETQLEKTVASKDKELSDCNHYHQMTRNELNSMNNNINSALQTMMECKPSSVGVETLQRCIGITQGRLEAALGRSRKPVNTCAVADGENRFYRGKL